PASTTFPYTTLFRSGLYFAHPEAKYFSVGKLDRDQVADYHLRKGTELQAVERWLGPYLNYEPGQRSFKPQTSSLRETPSIKLQTDRKSTRLNSSHT